MMQMFSNFPQNPLLEWSAVKKDIKKEGAKSVKTIKVNLMMEDWFLLDKEGLCDYLKIDRKHSRSLKGKDGNEKIQSLFRKANKIYQKGSYCDNFIPYFDLDKILSKIQDDIKPLSQLL